MSDAGIILYLNSLTGVSFYLDAFFYFVAKFVPYFMVAGIGYFLLRNFKQYLFFVTEVGLAVLFARYGIVNIIRYYFPRQRPFLQMEEVNLLLDYKEKPSFPSGHTALVFAIATVVYFYNKKIGIALYGLSLLVALSRVVVGMHWVSDVFAGAVAGVLAGVIVSEVFVLIKKEGRKERGRKDK